jgi:hypothetical protein
MGDGLLGKCKECTRKDSEERRQLKLKDPIWQEQELERCRKKAAKYRALGIKADAEALRQGKRRWDQQNRHKKRAHNLVKRAIESGKLVRLPCEICGIEDTEAHHDDYSKPLDVRFLCVRHHNDHHLEMRRLERFTQMELQASQSSATS